jgi:hypothetical protein
LKEEVEYLLLLPSAGRTIPKRTNLDCNVRMQNPFNKAIKCSFYGKTSGPKHASKQVMKLGFVNLAKKISLTWMSRLTKDESH